MENQLVSATIRNGVTHETSAIWKQGLKQFTVATRNTIEMQEQEGETVKFILEI